MNVKETAIINPWQIDSNCTQFTMTIFYQAFPQNIMKGGKYAMSFEEDCTDCINILFD